MGVLDFRRFLPGQPQDYAGVQGLWQPGANFGPPVDPRQIMASNPNVWATGGTASGPGTFSVPVQSDGAPQQKPPPAEPEKYGPTNPAGKPPIMAGIGGAATLSPMGTAAPVTPPVTPAGLKEVYGPGASQSSVTGAPTKPIEPAFNPDVREAVRETVRKTAEGGTPAVQAGNAMDKLMALQKEGKLGPVIAALAKSFGAGGGGPAPPAPWRSSMHPGNPGFNQPQGGSQMLQQLMESSISSKAQKAWEKKKSQQRRERDRYDILGGKG
jgi:hypothetical protein